MCFCSVQVIRLQHACRVTSRSQRSPDLLCIRIPAAVLCRETPWPHPERICFCKSPVGCAESSQTIREAFCRDHAVPKAVFPLLLCLQQLVQGPVHSRDVVNTCWMGVESRSLGSRARELLPGNAADFCLGELQ